MDIEPKFFNPFEEIEKTAHNLPHWQQPGATYFITFRLADSIPATLLRGWEEEREAWLARHPEPWTDLIEREYHVRFSGRIDTWLDDGYGACHLREASLRMPLTESVQFRDGDRYRLHAWVAMPNHVHLLATLREGEKLESEVGAWKSVSAHRINGLLNRSGALWQEDYFDRLIRDREHFANCVRYIRRNPGKARLRVGEYGHYESDLATRYVE